MDSNGHWSRCEWPSGFPRSFHRVDRSRSGASVRRRRRPHQRHLPGICIQGMWSYHADGGAGEGWRRKTGAMPFRILETTWSRTLSENMNGASTGNRVNHTFVFWRDSVGNGAQWELNRRTIFRRTPASSGCAGYKSIKSTLTGQPYWRWTKRDKVWILTAKVRSSSWKQRLLERKKHVSVKIKAWNLFNREQKTLWFLWERKE